MVGCESHPRVRRSEVTRVVAIQQPEHAPWIGFFNKMAQCDLFVYLDHVQFKKRYFENRNRLKTRHGVQWFTVPVLTKGKYRQRIRDVRIDNTVRWLDKYKGVLMHAYGGAPFWRELRDVVWPALDGRVDMLSDLNVALIEAIKAYLNISVAVVRASSMCLGILAGSDLILAICERVGAGVYISGPDGRRYLDTNAFRQDGIGVLYHEYDHPIYPQRFGDFASYMSVFDLIAHCGPESGDIVRGRLRAEAC